VTPDVGVDVIEFEQQVRPAIEAPRPLSPTLMGPLRAGVEKYVGDLLEGDSTGWCTCERERLREMFLQAAELLMVGCESEGDLEEGIDLGLRVLTVSPTRERIHRRIIRLHSRLGNVGSAVEQYERCVQVLREALDAPVSPRTSELIAAIRDRGTDDGATPPEPGVLRV